jgi:hypothetical protein
MVALIFASDGLPWLLAVAVAIFSGYWALRIVAAKSVDRLSGQGAAIETEPSSQLPFLARPVVAVGVIGCVLVGVLSLPIIFRNATSSESSGTPTASRKEDKPPVTWTPPVALGGPKVGQPLGDVPAMERTERLCTRVADRFICADKPAPPP